MQNSIGSNVETLYQILDNKAEALEFAVHETSGVTNIPLSELNLKKNPFSSAVSVVVETPGFPEAVTASR